MSKSISQLESLNRELQERNRILENSKSQTDKEYYQLQAALEAERRDRGHDSEMIGDLQGNFLLLLFFFYCGKIYVIKVTIYPFLSVWFSCIKFFILLYNHYDYPSA